LAGWFRQCKCVLFVLWPLCLEVNPADSRGRRAREGLPNMVVETGVGVTSVTVNLEADRRKVGRSLAVNYEEEHRYFDSGCQLIRG